MSGWWRGSRDEFLKESPDHIAGKLNNSATLDGLNIQQDKFQGYLKTLSIFSHKEGTNRLDIDANR